MNEMPVNVGNDETISRTRSEYGGTGEISICFEAIL